MRFSRFLLTISALSAASAALAQDSEPSGLSDLQGTVNELQDEPPPGETQPTPESEEPPPAQPTPTPEAEAAPAETQPEPTPEPEAPPPPQPAPPRQSAPTAPSAPAPPLTRAELAAVERTAQRGRLLVAIARAGLIATRDMLSRVSDPEGAGIGGWIAEPEGNAMGVTFYADTPEGPRAVYRASVLGGRVVSRNIHIGGDRPALTPVQARMAAARAATDGLPNRACSDQPFNVLVVPPAAADAPVDVYQVTAPGQRARFPLGGHFRSTVAADGTVSASRGFTNSCVDLEAAPVPAGQQPRPIGVTHLLDPAPTEIHVLVAQLSGRPLLVATGDPQRVWLVTGERIAEVRP